MNQSDGFLANSMHVLLIAAYLAVLGPIALGVWR